jgi:imidazolonepropionase-like amidohydrolase
LHDSARRDLREMRAAGVSVLAGTDLGVLNVVPGRSLHEELALLVRDAGMSPLEALRAATSGPAVFMHRAEELGVINVGRRADLVLLDADPLTDITNVSRISAVVVRGRLFDREALARLREDATIAPDIATNDWPRASPRR